MLFRYKDVIIYKHGKFRDIIFLKRWSKRQNGAPKKDLLAKIFIVDFYRRFLS